MQERTIISSNSSTKGTETKQFKILNYIFVKVPKDSANYELSIPYNNYLWYTTSRIITGEERKGNFPFRLTKEGQELFQDKGFFDDIRERKAVTVKYIKPNTAIRYKIKGKLLNFVIIKINKPYGKRK